MKQQVHDAARPLFRCLLLVVLSALVAAPGLTQEATSEGPVAVVETEQGAFTIRLLPGVAPGHAAHFETVAREGGFDGTTFHRIIPGGIIQGGDPLSKDPAMASRYGTGGLDLLEAEFSDRPFARGVVAAARKPSNVDSGGSQFFICIREQPSLLGQYTIFGEVIEGMEAVDAISMTPVDGDKPTKRVEMTVRMREAGESAGQ